MSKNQKRLEKMRNNPKNVSFGDAISVLLSLGFEEKRIKGSHHHYVIEVDGESHIQTIPFKRPHIGRVYVKQILALIDELELLDVTEDNKDDEGEQGVDTENHDEEQND